jgi:phosphotriesterase-related protein
MAVLHTARGDTLDTDALGLTLVTECIIGPRLIEKEMNWPDHTFAETPREGRIADAVQKLEHAKDAGVDTIVDRVIPGLGRDVRLVNEIAKQVRVNIIVATGWYTWRDLPLYFVFRQKFPDLQGDKEPSLEDLFVRDIEDGVADTGVRAGIIKVVSDEFGITEDVRTIIRAAAGAHRRTGAPITTHTQQGAGARSGLEQQAALREDGVDLSRVIIGHVDWTDPDTPLDDFERLLDAGSYISFDTIGLDPQWPPDYARRLRLARIERIGSLIERGWVNQLMISHDNSCYYDVQPMHQLDFPTYTEVIVDFLPKLRERGVTEDQIAQMMVRNPRDLFATTGKGGY